MPQFSVNQNPFAQFTSQDSTQNPLQMLLLLDRLRGIREQRVSQEQAGQEEQARTTGLGELVVSLEQGQDLTPAARKQLLQDYELGGRDIKERGQLLDQLMERRGISDISEFAARPQLRQQSLDTAQLEAEVSSGMNQFLQELGGSQQVTSNTGAAIDDIMGSLQNPDLTDIEAAQYTSRLNAIQSDLMREITVRAKSSDQLRVAVVSRINDELDTVDAEVTRLTDLNDFMLRQIESMGGVGVHPITGAPINDPRKLALAIQSNDGFAISSTLKKQLNTARAYRRRLTEAKFGAMSARSIKGISENSGVIEKVTDTDGSIINVEVPMEATRSIEALQAFVASATSDPAEYARLLGKLMKEFGLE